MDITVEDRQDTNKGTGSSTDSQMSSTPTLNDPRFDEAAGPSTDLQRSSRPSLNDPTIDDGAGSSKNFQMDSVPTLNDHELKERRLLELLKQKYISVYIMKRVNNCPDTRCTRFNATLDVVEHFLKKHGWVPRSAIQLDTQYEVPIVLKKLVYGMSNCVAVLLLPITTLRDYDIPTDRSAMPIVVLATKIHPYGNNESTESMEEATSYSDIEPINNGDLLMIWVCGHVESLSSIIKLTNITEDTTNVYSGHIHSIAEINYRPNVVFSRGNCLLVPAHNVLELTNGGQFPLQVEITLSVKEEELTD